MSTENNFKPQTPDPEPEKMSNEDWIRQLSAEFAGRGIHFTPTCGIDYGIRFDFCMGFRIHVPPSVGERKFRLVLIDADHDVKIADEILGADEYFVSSRKYFINYGFQLTECSSGAKIIQHRFNAGERQVLIDIPVETLGDTIAWFSYTEAFRRRHQCELLVCMADHVRPLFETRYPDIKFISREEKTALYPYAAYRIGIYFHDSEKYAPVDYRQVPLHHYAAYILGLDPVESAEALQIDFDREERTIKEPYVCIAVQASGMCKMWNHPLGWEKVVEFLKSQGYRVLCIDRDRIYGSGIHWSRIPAGAEDFTGEHPLRERAGLIRHADFFVGLGSGLSWLAWAIGTPVVLVSGFSMPFAEFHTPYRVINPNVCHGCYNDAAHRFVNSDYTWCPRHKNTDRHYECTRGITAKSVIDKIKQIPEFIKKQGEPNEQTVL